MNNEYENESFTPIALLHINMDFHWKVKGRVT